MRAEILTIGDELCRGEIVNTNASYFAARLWDLDITTRWMTSCNDDPDDMKAALTTAAGRADVIITSGGLGPTEDDLTVDVIAALLGVDAVVDEPAKAKMLERFGRMITGGAIPGVGGHGPGDPREQAARLEELTRIQLRQVRVPRGARVHANGAGLAPGFEVALGGAIVASLPGVPREVFSIWDGGLGARLRALREERGRVERLAKRIYRAFGRGESQVSQACRGLVDGVPGASIHYQVKFPETLVKLVVRDADQGAADARLASLDEGVRARLAGVVYGVGETETLVEKVTRRLIASGTTVATAESCTGGMLGELLTRMPGSSKAFVGGAITYSNDEKIRQLRVRPATLERHGAVSEETVKEMAEGISQRAHAQLGVAISGIAGPDGGTPDKPVGTVWIAVCRRDTSDVERARHGDPENDGTMTVISSTRTKKVAWPGARDQVRLLAAWWALKLIDEDLDRSGVA